MRWGSILLLAATAGTLNLAAQGVGTPAANGSSETSVYFSGQVQMEDGSAPAEPVLIQKICDGRTQDAAWTDAKGHFGFRVGGDSHSAVADASEMPVNRDVTTAIGYSSRVTNPVTSSLKNCQIHASVAGFESERVDISIRDTLDNTNVGTLILHPTSRSAELSISSTSLAAPASAKKAYAKGESEVSERKWDAAGKEFEKAVKEYPDFAAAWFELGVVRENQKNMPGAVEAWKEALKHDLKYAKPYEGLSAAAYASADWRDLDQYTRAWIQLDPEAFPQAYLFAAFAAGKQGHMGESERLALEGIRVDKAKRVPKLEYVLGVVLMQEGKNVEAAKCFRNYLQLSPGDPEAALIRQQLPKLETAATKTE